MHSGFEATAVMDENTIRELLCKIASWLAADGAPGLEGQKVHRLELALATDNGQLIVWPEDCTLGDMDMRANHHKVFINTLATSAQDLRQTRRQASHAAYVAQAPNGTDHLRIARDLLSDDTVPDDEMRLGTMNCVKKNKLARTLKKYTERPECIYFHCGTAMYPSDTSIIIITGLQEREECRAYEIYRTSIHELASERGVDDFTLFHCEPCAAPTGSRKAQHNGPYFKVHSCKRCAKMTKSDRHELLHIHQPHRYGLNDGSGSPPETAGATSASATRSSRPYRRCRLSTASPLSTLRPSRGSSSRPRVRRPTTHRRIAT
jgi:hypothetical protein